MSLATRCASCGTVFRVVQDQLKVSEGWVRCGRCNEVFNALEGLFDLDRELAPAWTPSQRGTLDLLPAGEAAAAGSADADVAHDGGGTASEPSVDTQIDTRVDSQIDTRQPEQGDDAGADAAADASGNAGAASAEAEAVPGFMRQAESAARWQRPQVRATLAVAAGLLGILLVAQVIVHRRDSLAAHWPAAAPLLAALCEPLDCRIDAVRRLDSVTVESSGLTQLDPASHYRLQVSLRNRESIPLKMPSLDVTLSDSRGDTVARKVLSPREFGAGAQALLPADSEVPLLAVLDAGERRITGYSIEIFYP